MQMVMLHVHDLRTDRSLTEPCHAKAGLKIFDIVTPKEGLTGTDPAKPSFGMTSTTCIKYNL